jgi:hypothetical protein
MSAEYIPFDRESPQEYVLQVEVGQPTAPDGVTQVRVEGTGAFEARQYRAPVEVPSREAERPASEGERVNGRISPEEVGRLMDQASLAPWGTRFPQRPGIPDEAIVVVSLRRGGRESASVKMWLRDAEKDEVVGPLLQQLREHLDQLGGGKIYL